MLRVLLVGCGDVALRVAGRLHGRAKILGLVPRRGQRDRLRRFGVVPVPGDLDLPASLARLRTAPFAVLHFAPPPGEGSRDPRTRNLLAALGKAQSIPRSLVYISTSGVYGDCAGERIHEARARRPGTLRARRRLDAEDLLRAWCRRHRVRLSILRAPGIYAERRLPVERIRQGTPVLRDEDDVYTNHIHADDLAAAAVAALFRGRPNRAYNVSDDSEIKMGPWFDSVADAFRLPRPPRVARSEATARLSPLLLSFMSESRRLVNGRMKRELRVRLAHSTPRRLLDEIGSRELRRQLALPI